MTPNPITKWKAQIDLALAALRSAKSWLPKIVTAYRGPAPTAAAGVMDAGKYRMVWRMVWTMLIAWYAAVFLRIFMFAWLLPFDWFLPMMIAAGIEYLCQKSQDYSK